MGDDVDGMAGEIWTAYTLPISSSSPSPRQALINFRAVDTLVPDRESDYACFSDTVVTLNLHQSTSYIVITQMISSEYGVVRPGRGSRFEAKTVQTQEIQLSVFMVLACAQ